MDVVSHTKESDLKGQALLNIGMMYHFGKGMDTDLELAQVYYEKAMKEDS